MGSDVPGKFNCVYSLPHAGPLVEFPSSLLSFAIYLQRLRLRPLQDLSFFPLPYNFNVSDCDL